LEKKCYGWKGTDGGGGIVLFLACAKTPGWTPNPEYGGRYFFPSDNGINLASGDYGALPISLTLLNGQAEIDIWSKGFAVVGSCNNCLDVFTTYCQGSKQAKVTVLNQEYIFQNAPIKVSCKGSTLIIEDNSGGGTNVGVPNCNSYKVSCDDNCPEGYCKIDCEAYPGYCCLNEAEIQSLSNQLR
ncbi:MAG: hypothetical protein ACYTX0_37395, partial [Nostoc sp.]